MFRKTEMYLTKFKLMVRFFSTKNIPKNTIVYSDTINLPKTNFPTRLKQTKLQEVENDLLNGSFAKLYSYQESHNESPAFILHDGPPYANGDLHMGHAVNKVLKDITIRQHVMQNRKIEYIPGWDCHGLPIEMKAMSTVKSGKADPLTIRKTSRQFALNTIEKQMAEFKSWGILADWSNNDQVYKTIDPNYISNQLEIFLDFYKKGLVYRDLKPVYWSPSSRTALAESELEYDANYESPSLILRLPIKNYPIGNVNKSNVYALVWTTTPWTLPSNQAVCFNPDMSYSFIELNNDTENVYLISTKLIDEFQKMTQLPVQIKGNAPVDLLSNCSYSHPFAKNQQMPFLAANHVQDNKGTGLVHTAPAHGPDDFLVSLQYKIPIICYIDENGAYTSEAPTFLQGKEVLKDGDTLVLNHLKEDTIFSGKITHSYPIDWRTKKPVIIRASEQWFINTESLKTAALNKVDEIAIYPRNNSETSQKLLATQIQKRPYWCISRQRSWGVPITVFYKKDTKTIILNDKIIAHIKSLLLKEGNIDFWWSKNVSELLPNSLLEELNLSADQIVKSQDIFDIWFDSGISWSNVLHGNKVADVYMEGFDQFNGWFQSSLLTSIASRNILPYKSLFVHGFTVDENGHKMSKSQGNVISPKQITKKFGTDVLRWWVASHGTQHTSITVSDKLFQQTSESLNKHRAVLRYLNGVVGKKSHLSTIPMDGNKLTYLDKYILHSLWTYSKEIQIDYDNYEYNRVVANIQNFITNKISSIYLHLIKDRLYCGSNEDHILIKTILTNAYGVLCKSLWPIVPFLIEESWSYYDNSPFYEEKIRCPVQWKNEEADNVINVALDVKRIMNQKTKDINTWKIDCIISCDSEKLAALQKLHPIINKQEMYTELCEILQVASVNLSPDDNINNCSVNISLKNCSLCPRCRRFPVDNIEEICLRCNYVMETKTK